MAATLLRPELGEVRQDLLAGGVAALDEREADLVALLGFELAILSHGGAEIEAALQQLAEDDQRLVAPAGGELGGGERVAVVGGRVGRLADEAQDRQRALGVLALVLLGRLRAQAGGGRRAIELAGQTAPARLPAGRPVRRAPAPCSPARAPASSRRRRRLRGERARPRPQQAREQSDAPVVVGGLGGRRARGRAPARRRPARRAPRRPPRPAPDRTSTTARRPGRRPRRRPRSAPGARWPAAPAPARGRARSSAAWARSPAAARGWPASRARRAPAPATRARRAPQSAAATGAALPRARESQRDDRLLPHGGRLLAVAGERQQRRYGRRVLEIPQNLQAAAHQAERAAPCARRPRAPSATW